MGNGPAAGAEMLRILKSHPRGRLACCVRAIGMPPGKTGGRTIKKSSCSRRCAAPPSHYSAPLRLTPPPNPRPGSRESLGWPRSATVWARRVATSGICHPIRGAREALGRGKEPSPRTPFHAARPARASSRDSFLNLFFQTWEYICGLFVICSYLSNMCSLKP